MQRKGLVRTTLISLLVGAIAGGGNLLAQDNQGREWKYRSEVFGGIGASRFYHGDHHLGNGLDWNVGAGFRPFSGAGRGLGFEVCMNGFNFDRSWGEGYSNQGDVLAVTGNALYHFGKGPAQFFVVGGLGALHADYQIINPYTRELYGDSNYVETHKATQLAVSLGLGVKARIASHFSVRPEIRYLDTTVGEGYNWGNLRFSVGIGCHF